MNMTHDKTPDHRQINVLILQTDNRIDVDYIGLTKLYNSRIAEFMQKSERNQNMNYRYQFFHLEEKHYENMHPAMGKIGFLDEVLNTITDDIIVFLDTDAWVNEPTHLQELLDRLVAAGPDIHGCFSRDPYVSKNTYVNSGSFVLRVTDFTRNMYKEIIAHVQRDDSHHNLHSYDQYYISQFIYDKREHFMVFVPEILNTAYGKILRHNWWKDQKMFKDLYDLLDTHNHHRYLVPEPFDFEKAIDPWDWPNPNEHGHEYW
jgi:hypothetical protein